MQELEISQAKAKLYEQVRDMFPEDSDDYKTFDRELKKHAMRVSELKITQA